ncbi:MAG: type II secretion system protein GspM [Pseudohongiella sp.]|nr:type II secretion system protein GspM [Pseudohongiella sp.]MDP2284998.1 type II secretion system protein GspM [Pseudohongiella sp.]
MQKVLSTSTHSIAQLVRTQWQARSPRERQLLAITTTVMVVSLTLWLLISGHGAVTALHSTLPALRMQAETVERQASELERLRLLPAPAASAASLLPMVQEMAIIAGLTDTLSSLDALDSDRVVVAFGTIPFPMWIDWLHTLSLQGIRVESITMETLLTPGLVSTRATLLRAGTQ